MAGGRAVSKLVQAIDIAPTVLDFLGMPRPGVFQGRSFLPLLRGEEDGPADTGVAYIKGNWKYVIRTDRWKLFWNAREDRMQLFDLETDPAESVDLAARRPDVAAGLKDELARFLSEEGRPLPRHAMKKKSLTPMDQEKKEKLRALGYIW
jgi:arylsulfatase A-like enzyme